MSIWWALVIGLVLIGVSVLLWCIKDEFYNEFSVGLLGTIIILIIVFALIGIVQPFMVRKELVRQEKERQQIIYQIENMTEESDKVKLNEWILTYNDWVNDVNTSKEMYGWFSRYYTTDMSEHEIIDLV